MDAKNNDVLDAKRNEQNLGLDKKDGKDDVGRSIVVSSDRSLPPRDHQERLTPIFTTFVANDAKCHGPSQHDDGH